MLSKALIKLLTICCLFALAAAAAAETLSLLPASAPAPSALPQRGASMTQVEKQFGAPLKKYPPAGGDSPKHPPITRWDYLGFSAYFERQRLIDAVVPAAPPRLYHTDQLESAAR
jgi:hypothetical protein